MGGLLGAYPSAKDIYKADEASSGIYRDRERKLTRFLNKGFSIDQGTEGRVGEALGLACAKPRLAGRRQGGHLLSDLGGSPRRLPSFDS